VGTSSKGDKAPAFKVQVKVDGKATEHQITNESTKQVFFVSADELTMTSEILVKVKASSSCELEFFARYQSIDNIETLEVLFFFEPLKLFSFPVPKAFKG